MNGETPCAQPNIFVKKRANICSKPGQLHSNLNGVCVICQGIAIITSYQQNLEIAQISDYNMVDVMRIDSINIATSSRSFWRSRKVDDEVRLARNRLLEAARYRYVDLVLIGCEI